jgi:hypothetical protein
MFRGEGRGNKQFKIAFVNKKETSHHSVRNLLSSDPTIQLLRYTDLKFCMYLCGFETWSLTLREERRLRVFENWVLGRVFGNMKGKITGQWRRLHSVMRSIINCTVHILE